MHVWNCFKRACEVASKRVVSYTKFIELWQQFPQNLVVAKPMTELCFTCQHLIFCEQPIFQRQKNQNAFAPNSTT